LSFPTGHLALLSGLLGAAALWEIRSRRIPNFFPAVVVGTGLLAQLLVHGALALASGLGACLLMAAASGGPWLKGFIGGGDLKLAAGLAVWTGLPLLPAYALAAALSGGAVAVFCYMRSNRENPEGGRREPHQRRPRPPASGASGAGSRGPRLRPLRGGAGHGRAGGAVGGKELTA
jgi:prepilin peptidase CpaA